MSNDVPTYDQLMRRRDAPAGSSWGLFTESPERGMANFAGPEQVRSGMQTVRIGQVIGLDYAIDAFQPSMSRRRTPPQQTITSAHPDSYDDVWTGFWPQVSSHVDGLRHRRSHRHGFYGGVPDDQIASTSTALGVQQWADRPIAGRAVLADIDRYRHRRTAPLDHRNGEAIGVEEIRMALADQHVSIEPGDLLLIHTGWAAWFLSLDHDERAAARTERRTTGLAQSRELLAWLWDSRIALVGTDTFAVEALPPRDDSPFEDTGEDHGMMHQELLAMLGCPLGELWRLDELAAQCARHDRYAFFASVKPLNLPGGVGSPANALAIL